MLKICHKPILDESSTYSASGEISASVGNAKLSGSNPIGLKPRAVASTSAKSGAASSLRAKVDVNNNGTSTSTTGWAQQSNTSKVSTSKLVTSTEKAQFHGSHQIKKTKTSAWQVKTTNIKF
ncbi:hypothetical protein ABEY41_22935 [Peribacillus butanolivorans]|uniref:hypothetical protein n=1 Tax=Peribacillus butanolivorans TaxID=421767 RepID=UPI003D2DB669